MEKIITGEELRGAQWLVEVRRRGRCWETVGLFMMLDFQRGSLRDFILEIMNPPLKH